MKYYDTNELADKLNVTQQAITHQVRKGNLKPCGKVNKQFIFSDKETKKYIEKYKSIGEYFIYTKCETILRRRDQIKTEK